MSEKVLIRINKDFRRLIISTVKIFYLIFTVIINFQSLWKNQRTDYVKYNFGFTKCEYSLMIKNTTY